MPDILKTQPLVGLDGLNDMLMKFNGVDTAQSRTVDVAIISRSSFSRHFKVGLSKMLKRRATTALEDLND